MARSLESDVLSNQNITSALEIGSYTAAATRIVYLRVLVDQAAGNGDYVIYATLQVGGSGSAYRLIPITTAAAANTVTAIGFVSLGVPVESGDVLKVYLTGLAGDTTTPDTRVDYYEHDYLKPTTADRTLDVTATGEAGIDWANVGSPTTTVGLSGTTVKTATDVETDTADIQGRLPAALTGAGNIKADALLLNGATPNNLAAGAQMDLVNAPNATALNASADALLDRAAGVETSFTLRQAMRLVLATLAGKLSGAATTTVTIRDVNDSKNRIIATVDADGNRSAVTTDVS